jgi:uncharacterized protein with PQ loop repeat
LLDPGALRWLNMHMLLVLLGTLGIVLIEVSYLPQLLRLYTRKDADDVALLFPTLNLGGRLAALGYAVAIGEPIFSLGLIVGVGVRFAFFAMVMHYKFLRPRLVAQVST